MRELAHPLLTYDETSVPSVFGGLADDFWDAAHIGHANSDVLLAYLLERRRDSLTSPEAA
jgi:hypothetical protein